MHCSQCLAAGTRMGSVREILLGRHVQCAQVPYPVLCSKYPGTSVKYLDAAQFIWALLWAVGAGRPAGYM